MLLGRASGVLSLDPFLQEALEELSTSLEELQVAGEEFRVQNDELIATRNAVEQERQRYKELFEFTPDGYLVTDPFGIIREANRAASTLLSVPKEFLLGKSLVIFVAEEDRRLFRSQLLQMARLEQLQDWEVRLKAGDKYLFPAGITVSAIRDKDNNLAGLRWLIRDITRRKRAEEDSQRAKQKFQLLSETASRLLTSENPQSVVNELCQKVMTHLDCHVFLNYLVEDDKQRLRLNAYAGVPDDIAKEIEWIDYGVGVCGSAARDGCRIVAEDILNRLDPRTELLRCFGIKAYACHPLFSAGQVIGTLSFGTRSRTSFTEEELSVMKAVGNQVAIALERARLIESLRESRDELELRVRERTAELTRANELLEKMFSSINVMIAYMDKDFNFIRVNRAYAEADEREPDFFIGKNHFHLYPNEENQRIFRKVVETGQPYLAYAKPFEYAEHPDRGVTYWDWSLQPIREPDGSVGGLILSVLNVTDRVRAQERIEAERRRFNEVLESLPVFVALVTQEGLIRFANRVFRERFGGFCKRGYFEFMLGQAEPCEVCETYKAPKTSAPVRGEWSGPDGHIYEIFEFPFTDTDGSALILYMGVDITDQKEAQKQIEATNALLSLFLRMSSRKEFLDRVVELLQDWSGCRCAGIRVVDRQGNIPYDSYRGFSREFWESENFLSIKDDQCVCIRVVTGQMDPQELPVVTPAGSFYCSNTLEFIQRLSHEEQGRYRGACVRNGFLSVAIIPIRYGEKTLGAIHLADEGENRLSLKALEFIESMSPLIGEAVHRFNLEEQLRESEQRLRMLSSELLTAQEKERRQVARDLHDGVGQMLSAIKFKIEEMVHQKQKAKQMLRLEPLDDLVGMIRESIEEVRRLQMDLRPPILDDLGIVATISWFVREFEKTYSAISVRKEIDIEEGDVPSSLKIVIYRILQESLNNVAKHSKASRATVWLGKRDHRIHLTIEDNGIGFHLEDRPKGFGLESMKERTELSGGSFIIESTIGAGTIVRASWPIQISD